MVEALEGFISGYYNAPVKVKVECVENSGILEDLVAELQDIAAQDWMKATFAMIKVFKDIAALNKDCLDTEMAGEIVEKTKETLAKMSDPK